MYCLDSRVIDSVAQKKSCWAAKNGPSRIILVFFYVKAVSCRIRKILCVVGNLIGHTWTCYEYVIYERRHWHDLKKKPTPLGSVRLIWRDLGPLLAKNFQITTTKRNFIISHVNIFYIRKRNYRLGISLNFAPRKIATVFYK